MSNESAALKLFEQANPIPDPEVFRSEETDATAYLASITTRSSTMVQTEERPTQESKVGRWLIAAAAIVIAIVGFALVLNQGGDAPPPATDPPVTTTLAVSDPTGYWVVDEVRILALQEDGTYFWMSAGFVSDEGRWRISTDRLTFVSSVDSQSCDENATGSHAFSMEDADTLRVEFRTDDCDGERDIAPLAGSRTFTRTEPVERP